MTLSYMTSYLDK